MLRARWTWVACLAVLCAGQSNAHLHYCFDGQEPPVSLHLTDGIDHGHEHAPRGEHGDDHVDDHDSNDHDDLDVDLNLTDQALAKVLKLDQPVIAGAYGFRAFLAPPSRGVFIEWIELPPSPIPIHARPQPRGPPG